VGWAYTHDTAAGLEALEGFPGVKVKLIQFLHAVRLLARVPLIAINTLVVLLKLVLG